MARAFAHAFYTSPAWRFCRAAYLAERRAVDGGMCERCHDQLGYIVHHREWLTPENINDPDVALNHRNLEYVCLTCHNKIEQGEDAARYQFGPDGQVLPP